MILHELINNAARHAVGAGIGRIRVELATAGECVACKVLDNGSAAESVQPGRGLRIISELANGLGGRFEQRFGRQGSMFVITFPLEPCIPDVVAESTTAEMADVVEQPLDVSASVVGR
jgi:two-component sensor histidine kinase